MAQNTFSCGAVLSKTETFPARHRGEMTAISLDGNFVCEWQRNVVFCQDKPCSGAEVPRSDKGFLEHDGFLNDRGVLL
jgi:hypothetical protein